MGAAGGASVAGALATGASGAEIVSVELAAGATTGVVVAGVAGGAAVVAEVVSVALAAVAAGGVVVVVESASVDGRVCG